MKLLDDPDATPLGSEAELYKFLADIMPVYVTILKIGIQVDRPSTIGVLEGDHCQIC